VAQTGVVYLLYSSWDTRRRFTPSTYKRIDNINEVTAALQPVADGLKLYAIIKKVVILDGEAVIQVKFDRSDTDPSHIIKLVEMFGESVSLQCNTFS